MFNREREDLGAERPPGDMMREVGVYQAREWGWGERQSRCEACFPEDRRGAGRWRNGQQLCVEWRNGVGDQ